MKCVGWQDRPETAAKQWQCFKLVMFSHIAIQVVKICLTTCHCYCLNAHCDTVKMTNLLILII